MTRIIVSGPRGRMGSAILRLAAADSAYSIVALLDSVPASRESSQTAPTYQSLAEVPDVSGAVLLEFTNPEATLTHVRQAVERRVPTVVGTTGFSAEQRTELEGYGSRIPLLIAANTSVGVNVLLEVVGRLSGVLSDYDLEIVETHHRLKKDAPSGTALAFAEAAAGGRQVELSEVVTYGRSGLTGERPKGEIGIHAVRVGDVVGEHTITFAGPGERIEIVHRAHSRDTFAAGALRVAGLLQQQPPRLYCMGDLLQVGKAGLE